MSHRLFVLCLIGAAAFPVAAAADDPAAGDPAAGDPAGEELAWTAREAVTSVWLREPLLADLGVTVSRLETSAPAADRHPLSVSPGAPAFAATAPWGLRFTAPEGRFGDFVGGSLRHQGGFELGWKGGGTASLHGFELRPGAEPRSLELLSAAGEHLFTAEHLHYELDVANPRLRVFNADLEIAAAFAESLGQGELAGISVGLLSFDAAVDVPEGVPAPDGGCPPNWDGDVDVALIEMPDVDQVAREGGLVVIAPSARLKNVGTADVPWHSKFSGNFPPYGNDQHPFLVWGLYRVAGGVMRQLAVSDVKHAFFTINDNCTGCGIDNHVLGLGCEDVYSVGTNTNNGFLGPRPEIRPNAGIWAHCDEPEPNTPCHFDPDGDCDPDHNGEGEDAFSHGLTVDELELMDPDADYYFHAWYVVRDDVDIWNTMGFRQIEPTLSGGFTGGIWTFPFLGDLAAGSPLDAWVDPVTPGSGASNQVLEAAGGHLQLAMRTAGGSSAGRLRFHYALANHDYDRRIRSFSLPLSEGLTLSGIAFHDLDDDPANDWQATVGASAITWQASDDADSLDWGEMFTFSFEADAQPVSATATLLPTEAGDPTEETISTLSAGDNASLIFADGFESGDTSAWE